VAAHPPERSLDSYLDSLGPSALRAAEVGGDVYVGGGWKQYLRLIYPDFDICALLTDQGRFDVVICEQHSNTSPTLAGPRPTSRISASPAVM
jgi:hypothetical protein